jgi:hypothetical protein
VPDRAGKIEPKTWNNATAQENDEKKARTITGF